MSDKTENISIRVPVELLEQLDQVQHEINTTAYRHGVAIQVAPYRSDVIRAVLIAGLAAFGKRPDDCCVACGRPFVPANLPYIEAVELGRRTRTCTACAKHAVETAVLRPSS